MWLPVQWYLPPKPRIRHYGHWWPEGLVPGTQGSVPAGCWGYQLRRQTVHRYHGPGSQPAQWFIRFNSLASQVLFYTVSWCINICFLFQTSNQNNFKKMPLDSSNMNTIKMPHQRPFVKGIIPMVCIKFERVCTNIHCNWCSWKHFKANLMQTTVKQTAVWNLVTIQHCQTVATILVCEVTSIYFIYFKLSAIHF